MDEQISNFKLSLKNLTLAIDLLNLSYQDDELFPEEMEEVIQEAVIKRFEYCYDLAQDIIKTNQTHSVEIWQEIQNMRAISPKSYEPEIADGLSQKIISEYHQFFINLKNSIKN